VERSDSAAAESDLNKLAVGFSFSVDSRGAVGSINFVFDSPINNMVMVVSAADRINEEALFDGGGIVCLGARDVVYF